MAHEAESRGAFGWWTADSPAIGLDPYVALSFAAQATTSLRLGVFVTNPFTRHPVITATAAASLHLESGGRMILAVGRGDSALAHLGLGPTPIATFETYVQTLNSYLRGEEVPFADVQGMPPLDSMRYHTAPIRSRIDWLPSNECKVPLAIAASGPKMLTIAGRHADRVLLGTGCDEDRVRWAIETVRAAADQAGRNANDIRIMLQTIIGVSDEPFKARHFVASRLAAQARFSAMQGRPAGPLSESDKNTMEAARALYDMNRHGQQRNDTPSVLDDDFIDRHAVTGTVEHVLRRLTRLAALGIDEFVFVYGVAPEPEWRPVDRVILDHIIPALAMHH
jgi:5,10-methylenetetrahydromethanopterin reductase